MDPVGSFFKFTVGFMVFISVSFGVTYVVVTLDTKLEKERQQAAALKALLE